MPRVIVNEKYEPRHAGYDVNDLDLDLFTGKIIHNDISNLKKTPCYNTYHSHQSNRTIKSISETVEKFELEKKERRDRAGEIVEVDIDGDGQGDGYGLGDDVFGIRG